MVLKVSVKKEARSSGESSVHDDSSDSDEKLKHSRLKSSVAVRKRSASSSRSRSRSPSTDRFGRIKRRPSSSPPPNRMHSQRRPQHRSRSRSPNRNRNQNRDRNQDRNRNGSRPRSRSPDRRRRRSPSRSRSPIVDRKQPADDFASWRLTDQSKHDSRPQTSRDTLKAQENDFWNNRRLERSKVCEEGQARCWGHSPTRQEIERIYTRDSNITIIEQESDSDSDSRKKKKKEKKRKKDKSEKKGEKKKSKKSKKKKRKATSDDSASNSDEEQWVEVTKEVLEQQQTAQKEEDAAMIGPQLPVANIEPEEAINPAIYGKDMLKGEAAAMAAYIAQGKRIPRRGEIGLSSSEI
uniref:NF-kappa-B-activating protein C-terminal domain-containing protein n=1 Tax=Plectus sambesii TaxID=2011161 RepID=A0A914X1Q8_9BILA